ncbi:hypothetical protein LCGC14_2139270 [marine sediment metagenome]|uniref:Uncharacterized protein n=1 Tax=marine sediment metagenome TaxID=412755 RepID=A0A0F9DYU2_9ZZZZ
MKIEPGTHCPLLDKECIQFKCVLWTQLRGTHPQTGQEVDEYSCAIAWLPMLLIENAKEVKQGAAATESFRNVMLELNKGTPPEVIEDRAMRRAIKDGS